jgi:hypothetical protein
VWSRRYTTVIKARYLSGQYTNREADVELEELAEGNEGLAGGLAEWLALVESAGAGAAGSPDPAPDWVDAYEV